MITQEIETISVCVWGKKHTHKCTGYRIGWIPLWTIFRITSIWSIQVEYSPRIFNWFIFKMMDKFRSIKWQFNKKKLFLIMYNDNYFFMTRRVFLHQSSMSNLFESILFWTEKNMKEFIVSNNQNNISIKISNLDSFFWTNHKKCIQETTGWIWIFLVRFIVVNKKKKRLGIFSDERMNHMINPYIIVIIINENCNV